MIVEQGTPVANNWYSTDGGVSWAASSGGPAHGTGNVFQWINPNTGTAITRCFDTYTDRYWRSDDGGLTYTAITHATAGITGSVYGSVCVGPSNEWFMFTASGLVFYHSTDDGLTFSPVTADVLFSSNGHSPSSIHTGEYIIGANTTPQSDDPYSAMYGRAVLPTTFFLPYLDTPTNVNSVYNMYVKVL
jgi:hypothetical protein